MQTKLKEMKRRLDDQETALRPFVPNLVQVIGEGRVRATADQQLTSIELNVPSQAMTSLSYSLSEAAEVVQLKSEVKNAEEKLVNADKSEK